MKEFYIHFETQLVKEYLKISTLMEEDSAG